jgi:hypothetical protein
VPRSFCRSPPPAGTIGLRRYRLRPDDVVRRVKVSPGKCRCERRVCFPRTNPRHRRGALSSRRNRVRSTDRPATLRKL